MSSIEPPAVAGGLCFYAHDPNEYWRAANKAMHRMSEEDLAAVADIFKRTARRTARHQR